MSTQEFEQRTYIISGEQTPEKWEAVLQYLGELGVSGQSISNDGDIDAYQTPSPCTPELELYEGPRLSKRDVTDFAAEIDESSRLAGRAWNLLTRLYIMKHTPTYLQSRSWYKPDEFEYVPLVFDVVPDEDMNGYYDINGLSALRPGGIKELLDMLEEANKHENPTTARKRIFGELASKKSIEFMQKLVEKFCETE